jgi:hypothetical protein
VGLSITFAAGLLRFDSRGTHDHILLFQIRDCPGNRLARLYLQVLGDNCENAVISLLKFSVFSVRSVHKMHEYRLSLSLCENFISETIDQISIKYETGGKGVALKIVERT